MASGKSLTPEENAKLKGVVEQLVGVHGSQKALAKAVPTSQQMISHVMNGGPAGVAFATVIAKFLQYNTYAEMLGGSVTPYGDAPSWKENEPAAMAMNPFPSAAYKLARETPAYIRRDHYSPQAIAATVVWRWAMATDDEKAKAASAEQAEELKKERARRKARLSHPPSGPTPKAPPARLSR
jgi:hypothetical protein